MDCAQGGHRRWVWRWYREGEIGGLDERQKWLEERWKEPRRARCGGVVRLESYAVDSHGVIRGVIIHRIVINSAVLEDLILDLRLLLIYFNLRIRVWQRCAHAGQYLKGELHRPQLRLDAFEAEFGLGFVVRFWVLLRVPLIGIGFFGLLPVTVKSVAEMEEHA